MTFRDRRPEDLFVTERVNVVWLSSLLDANAHLRLWVYNGEHVMLCNQHQAADPQGLLDAMDRHVIEMCQLLGADPPSDVAWMRASMLSFDKFSIGPWGVAEADQDAAALTALDRHEVAHAVISNLAGRDQDPPRFLVEGWAESQSADHNQLILALSQDTRRTQYLMLDDLLDEHWYRASRGPVYLYGGPFVVYLIRKYGGAKFLSVYRGVRQQSFRDDVRRILGVAWDDLESGFWDWLAIEADQIRQSGDELETAAEQSIPNEVEFANESDREMWQQLTDLYAQSIWANGDVPQRLSLRMNSSLVASNKLDSIKRELCVCVENGECFAHYTADSPSFRSSEFVVAKRDHYALASRQDDDDLVLAGGIGEKASVLQVISRYERMSRGADDLDPGQQIPLGAPLPPEIRRFRLDEISKPSGNDGLWYVKMADWLVGHESRDTPIRSEYWLDPTHELALVKRNRSFNPESMRSTVAVKLPEQAGEFFPLAMTINRVDGDSSFIGEVAIRQLNDREVRTLKQIVVSTTAQAKPDSVRRWYDWLPPATIGMLLLGMVCAADRCYWISCAARLKRIVFS